MPFGALRTSAGESKMGGANASDDKLLHIALAQAQGIENPLPASLKRAILHLDAGVSVIADIGQRGDVLAPIHVAEAGSFGVMKSSG